MRAAEALRAPLAAVAFLTRVPVARLVTLDGADVARGAALFPAVGAVIGAAVGGTAYGLARFLPELAAAGIALAVGALLTGALHLDGLADTADALGARTRDRALEIMRDHATGAYGATAIALDLVVKASALSVLAERRAVIVYAIAAGSLSRSAPVLLGLVLPSVREEGAGAAFRVAPPGALIAALIAIGVALTTGWRHGVVLVAVAAAVTVVLFAWYRRWLGGGTGDTLGAATELTETAVLVAAAALV
jgi:cobalamin 5'-phosphate synthase/cobalamin synthase